MTSIICHQIFISLYLKALIKNLVQIGTVVSEKIRFEFFYVPNLGPRSKNDLDLQYSHTFIYSIRCLFPLAFRSLAAIVFISLYLKALIKNLVQIGTVVSEKIQFEFLYVHDLWPRSRNDLDLQYSHIFIYSTKLQITGCNSF